MEELNRLEGIRVIWRDLGNRRRVWLVGGLLLAMAPMRLFAQTSGFLDQRRSMVEEQIVRRGVSERNVLGAMEEVPRHVFVPEPLRDQAYADGPLSISSGQTISQPYIVALMTLS